MTDQIAILGANVIVLVAAVNNLTAAINEHNRACKCTAHAATPLDMEIPRLSLSSSPPVPPSTSTAGESPDSIRERLEAQQASTQGQWYAITVGEEPGLYQDLAEVAHLTSGISGNAYKRYPSMLLALEAYERAWKRGDTRRVC